MGLSLQNKKMDELGDFPLHDFDQGARVAYVGIVCWFLIASSRDSFGVSSRKKTMDEIATVFWFVLGMSRGSFGFVFGLSRGSFVVCPREKKTKWMSLVAFYCG